MPVSWHPVMPPLGPNMCVSGSLEAHRTCPVCTQGGRAWIQGFRKNVRVNGAIYLITISDLITLVIHIIFIMYILI